MTVETELGPVEVEREGTGQPVLVIHGTPGGADAARALGGFLLDAGFEVIAPSRPGYLGTPLDGRETIDSQADLLAALVAELGLGRVGVLTWSGGGPSGYRLAVRHPAVVGSLVAFAAVSGRFKPAPASLDERLMLETSAGNWLLRFMSQHAERTTIRATIGAEGDVTRAELADLVDRAVSDPRQRHLVLTMARAVADRTRRGAGVDNDWRQFEAIDSLEIERIAAPTLIVGGDADTDVPLAHSTVAAERIPGADLVVIDRGTHLGLVVHPEAEATQRLVAERLRNPGG
ncbi:alpha/beta hydrolase [Thermoleophilia bacterium SCSIO 60948]|nr:alpha/beta hydrolase [Thermoleophilia bacterium SCSIO 60948]